MKSAGLQRLAFAILLAASLAVGCNSSISPVSPSRAPSSGPDLESTTAPLSASGTTIVLPVVSGYGATAVFPSNNAPAGTIVTLSLYAPSTAGLSPAALRAVSRVRSDGSTIDPLPHGYSVPSGDTLWMSANFTISQLTAFSSGASFSFTIPKATATSDNFRFVMLSFVPSDAGGSIEGSCYAGGPATFNMPCFTAIASGYSRDGGGGTVVSFGTGGVDFTFNSLPYVYALVVLEDPTLSPPVPTATPTVSPAGPTPTASPTITPAGPTPTASPTATPFRGPTPTASPTAPSGYVCKTTYSSYAAPASNAGIAGIAVGPDSALWFAETNASAVGRITTSGSASQFGGLTSSSEPKGIVKGSDGNLWFTEYAVNKIGRITPSGTVSEFAVPTSHAGPYGIAAGPDGALWFTEYSSGKVGRITTGSSPTVTEFALPGPSSNTPGGITTGPDGSLWIVLSIGTQVDRVTTSGAVTTFPIPAPYIGGFGQQSIAAGPDGALWFTESNGSAGLGGIGRISTSGVVNEFAAPVGGSAPPSSIAVGPDGALWFTLSSAFYTSGSQAIGRVTTSGIFAECPIGGAYDAFGGIVAGPDGALWFTQFADNVIGRYAP
jgi:virginiamycin B lyase